MAYKAKLNDELIENMKVEVENGLPFNYVCDLFQVHHHSFGAWMKQGETDFDQEIDTIYAKFYCEIKKSYARYIRHTMNRIKKGEEKWQSLCWWLERTNKEFRITSDDSNVTEPVIVNPTLPRNK